MRSSERMPVDAPARLQPNEWSSVEVRLLDCSRDGFRAASDARVPSGMVVTLDLPGLGPTRAQVSWHRPGEFGARFIERLERLPEGLAPAADETLLARLLVQRAEAHAARLWDHERDLRRKIAETLPLKRD